MKLLLSGVTKERKNKVKLSEIHCIWDSMDALLPVMTQKIQTTSICVKSYYIRYLSLQFLKK